MTNDEAIKAVNESGFPLQLALKLLANRGDWRVFASEYPWRDPSAAEGKQEKFIDLIIEGRGQTLVIECKRFLNSEWIFLRDENTRNDRTVIRARAVLKLPSGIIDDWIDAQCIPGTAIGTFCVTRKNGSASTDMLETRAAELVRATNEVACDETRIWKRRGGQLNSRLLIPVIVTTARLFVCDTDYSKVDLKNGEIETVRTSATEVPFLRFSKSLGAAARPGDVAQLADLTQQTERSVVIVQALNFTEFLDKWDLGHFMRRDFLEALLLRPARTGGV